MVSKSSTNPRLRSPKSNKSEAKWMLHFYCNLNSISGRPFVTSLISGRPHSSIHMPFGQNSLEKFTGKRVKKKQEKKETRKRARKSARKRGTRGRELEHTYSLEPPPPIV